METRGKKRCFENEWLSHYTLLGGGGVEGPPITLKKSGTRAIYDMYSLEGDWVLGPNPVRLWNHGFCLHSLNAKKNDWNHIAVDLKLTVLQLFGASAIHSATHA